MLHKQAYAKAETSAKNRGRSDHLFRLAELTTALAQYGHSYTKQKQQSLEEDPSINLSLIKKDRGLGSYCKGKHAAIKKPSSQNHTNKSSC